MIYTPREKLSIIELDEYKEQIAFEELEVVLWECPSNMIYVETAGVLAGIISMGDIDRAAEKGKRHVNINTSFTSVLPNEYMQARDIFRSHPSINALPVKFGGGAVARRIFKMG